MMRAGMRTEHGLGFVVVLGVTIVYSVTECKSPRIVTSSILLYRTGKSNTFVRILASYKHGFSLLDVQQELGGLEAPRGGHLHLAVLGGTRRGLLVQFCGGFNVSIMFLRLREHGEEVVVLQ
jgi:hypothetical protein